MKTFKSLKFNYKKCMEELQEFKLMLDNKNELSEKEDISPFFKEKIYLSTFLGSYVAGISNFDKYAFEFSIFDDFTCDIAVGDSKSNEYLFIELEDAAAGSIFQKNGNKSTLEWGKRFEHGYSQLIDWFWKLDDMVNTTDYKCKFGSEITNYQGMLVIGRDSFMEYKEECRLKWRRNKVLVDSKKVICVTYDELYKQLNDRLELYRVVLSSMDM